MYINPFVAGVLSTIGTELIVLVVAFIIAAIKSIRKK
jgi:hypothetical protein